MARLLVAAAALSLLAACSPSRAPSHAALSPSPAASASVGSPSPSPAKPTPKPTVPRAAPKAVPKVVPKAVPRAVPKVVPRAVPRPAPAGYVFPIAPAGDASFGHSHHDYPATDIFASCGDTYRASTAGRIQSVSTVDTWSSAVNAGASRGGLSVTLVGDDGVRYYGSHLRAIGPSVFAGARVAAGQTLGQVGNTGDARGIACHVHYGISPNCGVGDWYNRRGLVFPWPFLESWRAGGKASPRSAVAAYRARSGCPSGPTVDP